MNVIEEGKKKEELERLMRHEEEVEEVVDAMEDSPATVGEEGGRAKQRHGETWYPSNTQLVSEIRIEERATEMATEMALAMAMEMATKMATKMATDMIEEQETTSKSNELDTIITTLRNELKEVKGVFLFCAYS